MTNETNSAPSNVPNLINRRQHDRFNLQPMYTEIKTRFMDGDTFKHEGHAYDISEGGLQFELDRPIAPGTEIALQIMLPNWQPGDVGPGRAVFATGRVIWIDNDGVDGPVRMAAAFTRFSRAGDRQRLFKQMTSGKFLRAA